MPSVSNDATLQGLLAAMSFHPSPLLLLTAASEARDFSNIPKDDQKDLLVWLQEPPLVYPKRT